MQDNFFRPIAVIVPVYNAGNKIKSCIRSVLNQSFKDFSLILVDDGSTDKSGKICDDFARRDERICVIHQENKGSVEARKAGIYSDIAQKAKFLMLCDADDRMPRDALQVLLGNAEKYEADCVCGNMRRTFKNMPIPDRFVKFVPPCFRSGEAQIYDHTAVMKDLYVSCFGISNYPVSLCAKLYRRELLTDAAKDAPTVRYMGDDLSVTLRIMPNIRKLVIIPDTVYYYRMGGGTSKFMPYMLDDFLSLYCWKDKLRQQYEMDESVKILIDIELMNIVISFLQMCKCQGGFNETEIRKEVLNVISISAIKRTADSLIKNRNCHYVAKWIQNNDVNSVVNYLEEYYKKTKLKRTIKKLLKI